MAIATYEGNEPYIFVSYAHKDSDVVLPIIEALADNGFRVWYDAGIEAGSEWPSYIQDHITRCEKMIVFVTANCVKSPYCRREINLAVKLNKDILVVYLEDAELRYGLDFQLGIYQDIRRSNFTEERLFLQKLNEATILSSCRCASKFGTSAQKSTDSLLSDFEIENGVLKKYVGEFDAVVIPYGVKSIERAFSGCDQVKRVEIPNSVTRIGKHAFSRCASLINIMIPCSVTSIGGNAFYDCAKLTNVTIPNSVTSIGSYAFSYCASLVNVVIPDSVVSIEGDAFSFTGLESILIPDNVSRIGKFAFSRCERLKDVSIPDGLTEINGYMFSGCVSLTDITIPKSVTSIGEFVFEQCESLTSIKIPHSVKDIGPNAFCGCSNLTIYCEALSKPDGWDDDWNPDNRPVVWGWQTSSLSDFKIENGVLKKYIGQASEVVIPDGVKYIGANAFCRCSDLTSITIPNSVMSIGDGAFYGCSKLERIMIPDGVTSVGKYAFGQCSSLTHITIPEAVTYIFEGAFYGCSSLTSITIPDGVTSIGAEAFQGCASLTRIIIPDSVISIGAEAFEDCKCLTIYCEALSKPDGWWHDGVLWGWNPDNRPVVWGWKG